MIVDNFVLTLVVHYSHHHSMIENSYTKLFSTIVTSTIWREDDKTRIVWITMLALKNRHGDVSGSVPGLAHMANVSIEDCRTALQKLSSPDPDSRTKEFEGRRIQEVDGGWRILNARRYRDAMSEDERRVYRANWMREKRASVNSVVNKTVSTLTHADADAVSVQGGVPPYNPPLVGKLSKKSGNPEKYATARIVLHLLNEATDRKFRELDSNLSVIAARLAEPDVTLDGVKTMIARQCERWKGTQQEEYLRPETLFGKQKFDGYYAAKDQPVICDRNGKPGNDPNAAVRKAESVIHRIAARL